MAITMPPIAPAGLPPGLKDQLRADIRPNEFVKMVERGYRLVWQRATRCPCTSSNKQTDQADPNCPVCKGAGFLYFGPVGYAVDTNSGILTDSQKAIVAASPGGVIIRGIMTGIAANQLAVDVTGPRVQGMSVVTVRAENKLGFYDKITSLDNQIVYNQILKQGKTNILKARYPIIAINYLATLTKVMVPETDFILLPNGTIQWLTGKLPAEGTILTLHYNIHPTWIIVEHPRSVRVTTIKRKQKVPDSPMGSPVELPIQAVIKYDFLAGAV